MRAEPFSSPLLEFSVNIHLQIVWFLYYLLPVTKFSINSYC